MLVGIGVDIIEIDRVAQLCSKPQAAARLFSQQELDYAEASGHRAASLAGFFAAKEAVGKALGNGLSYFRFHDIEVLHDALKQPKIKLSGKALALAEKQRVLQWQLSLSHDNTQAIAFVVAEGV